MKFGVTMFVTEYSAHPTELAKAAEERGFDSIFFPEHTHIPTSRRTPYTFAGGGELPREYSHSLDPFVALSTAAAATQSLLLGTGACLVTERDPIVLAKEVASLDVISEGRVILGVGSGWNVEEMENHGTQPEQRWSILRERVLAMKAIWCNTDSEFHGRFVNFDPIWSWPKPVQTPHPPVFICGDGPGVLRRVIDYGDGWMPIAGRGGSPLSQRMTELNELAEEAGRAPPPVSVYAASPKPEVIEHYAEIGVQRAVFWLRPDPLNEVLSALDRFAEIGRTFR